MARSPEQDADAICEALMREGDLLKRYGRKKVILVILEGAEIQEIPCSRCHGKGSRDVVVESSGGTFYKESQSCLLPEGCSRTGRVRKLLMPHPRRASSKCESSSS